MLQASVNDDFVFTEEAQYVEYLDLAKSSSARHQVTGIDMSSDPSCRVTRPRESELANADRDISEAKLALRCKDSLQILTASGELQLKTEALGAASHGNLLRGFVAADSAEQMLLFEDLSLHYFQKNKRLWQREEALS